MKFAQLHYFSHKILGGQKILCPPLFKSWGDMSPRLNKLGPCVEGIDRLVRTLDKILSSAHPSFTQTQGRP